MNPSAGITLGIGLIAIGASLIDFYARRRHGAHGV